MWITLSSEMLSVPVHSSTWDLAPRIVNCIVVVYDTYEVEKKKEHKLSHKWMRDR